MQNKDSSLSSIFAKSDLFSLSDIEKLIQSIRLVETELILWTKITTRMTQLFAGDGWEGSNYDVKKNDGRVKIEETLEAWILTVYNHISNQTYKYFQYSSATFQYIVSPFLAFHNLVLCKN